MNLTPPIRLALGASRLLVGLLFIVSGLIKCNDITGFSYKLEEYFNVFEDHFGLPAAPFVATSVFQAGFIAVIETVLGLLLLLGLLIRPTAHALLYLIVFFTFLTGYSWLTNSVTDCGCFGDALKLTPFQSFVKDLVLLVLIGLIFRYRGAIAPLLPSMPNRAVGLAGSLLFLGYTLYGWHYEPVIDFRPACVGCDLRHNTTEADAEGVVKLPDYIPFAETCGQDEFEGQTLLILVKDLEGIAPDDLTTLRRVAAEAAQLQIKVMAGTATRTARTKELKAELQLPFCVHVTDQTLLKTMLRKQPGYLLLRDGVVVGKWPATAPPQQADLQARLARS